VHLVLLQHRAGAAAVLIGHHLGLSLFDDHLAGVRAFVDIHGDGLGDQLAARGHIVRHRAAGHYPGVRLANDAYLVVDEEGRYIEHGVVVVHQGDKGEFEWWLSTYFGTRARGTVSRPLASAPPSAAESKFLTRN